MAKIRKITKPGLHGDGQTLYLAVAPGGSKSWNPATLTIDGKRHDIGLGGWPFISLHEARDAAFNNRKLARTGGDPLAEKRRSRTPTFREAARRTFEANRPRWRNAKVEKNWMQQLERHAFPIIGKMRVDQIGAGRRVAGAHTDMGVKAGNRSESSSAYTALSSLGRWRTAFSITM